MLKEDMSKGDEESNKFWENFWMLPTTAEDVFAIFTPRNLRKLKKEQPGNLRMLVEQSVLQMRQMVRIPAAKATEYHFQALNCVRILTRVIPFLFEGDCTGLAQSIFWDKRKERKDETLSEATSKPTKALGGNPDKDSKAADAGEQVETCLAKLLIHIVLQMLFLPGFTVGHPEYSSDKKTGTGCALRGADSQLIWANGVGSDSMPSATPIDRASFDQNRTELLRLLMVCFSGTLYKSAECYNPYADKWLQFVASEECPHTANLFLSLLNCACTYDPSSSIPYAGALLTDYRESMVDISLHVLLILLDFSPPVARSTLKVPEKGDGQPSLFDTQGVKGEHPDNSKVRQAAPAAAAATTACATSPALPAVTAGGEAEVASAAGSNEGSLKTRDVSNTSSGSPVTPPPPVPPTINRVTFRGQPQNVFRKYLTSLDQSADFNLIFNGITGLLNNVHEANNTYLPNSLKQIESHQELLVLLWKLLDENRAFMTYILKYQDITLLLMPLAYFMFVGRNDPAKIGLIHICTFILLLLSGERNFGVALNKPFTTQLPVKLALFTGNHADLLVVVFHKLVVNGSKKLKTLHSCLLTIICNISPYAKTLSNVASQKLLSLFQIFASPRFIFRAPAAHQYVFFLLDIFNNLIQYQYEGNLHLVYAIVRRKGLFEALQNLPSKLADAAKWNQAAAGDKAFVPTEAWLQTWRPRMPLDPILRLLHYLEPQVKFLCTSDGCVDEAGVLKFLHNTTMVGLLPVPHPIVIRKYQPNQFTNLWFTTFIWGVIFLRNQELPFFDVKTIKLFAVTEVSID